MPQLKPDRGEEANTYVQHLRREIFSEAEFGSNMRISRRSSRKGLGLKTAALIAVSPAVIPLMTIVSGGDAIFGERPFTIAGFLIFFVIFWLMIAWIF
jgi:hypothetical protein